jgi:DNA polymerase III subunit gamma/tau
MEYRTLPLKWRPQNFDEVVGQRHITRTLKNAIKQNRVACAFLFAGPRGTGKTSTARILAKALNCKEGPAPEPCNKCQNCLEITTSNNLDVLEIDGASNRGIDQIRNLRGNVKLSPSSSRYKIYIIDEVHMLTEEASNALLKTLEEPPEHVKFIFATTRPQKVLPTILSRCQRYDFRRIPTGDIVDKLNKILKEEKIKIDEEAVFLIAKSTDGSLRDAESILDQFSSFSKKKITEEDVNAVMGSVGPEFIFKIYEKIIKKDTKGTLTLINEVINKGKDLSIFVAELIEHIRNLMIAKEADNYKDLIDLSDESIKRTKEQTGNFSREDLLYAFGLLSKAQDELGRFPIARIPIEMALIKLTTEGAIVKADELMSQLRDFSKSAKINEPGGSSKSNPTSTKGNPVNVPESDIGNLNGEEFEPVWRQACGKIKEIKTPVGLYISEGKPVRLEGDTLTIGFYPGFSFHRESLEDRGNKKLVEEVFGKLLNKKIKVDFISFTQTPPPPKKSPEDKNMKEFPKNKSGIMAEDKPNPIINSALKIFDGLIVKKENEDKRR